MTDKLSRRIFLKVSGAAAVTPAAAAVAAPAPQQHGATGAHATHGGAGQAGAAAGNTGAYLFLTPAESAFIEAAVDRLIPPDNLGPGGREAGVPQYIDRQLAGAWGAGERLYRTGPWHPGTPSQGYQLPFTPAEMFRNALRGIANDAQGKGFAQMDGRAQDAYLTALQNGTQDLEGVPAKTFFDSLLSMTIEGYFSDPVYGGNAGMKSWTMIGFPGAYGNYYEYVDQHGIAFNVPPRSLGQDADGHVHTMDVTAHAATTPRKGAR